MSKDETEIKEVCRAFGEAMRAMDYEAMEGLWDRGYDHLVYQPEEFERACRSWDAIVEYWNYIPGAVESVGEWREIESDVAQIGDGAIVFSLVNISLKLKDVDEPLEGEVRFTFGLRRGDDGWRLTHCHESRQLIVDAG